MQYILRHFQQAWRSKFARNVANIALGTASSQLLTIACLPFITRLYTAEAFGIYGFFNSFVGTLGPVVALSLPMAIILSKQGIERYRLILACLSVVIFMTLVLSIIISFFVLLNKSDSNYHYLILVAPVLFLSGLNQILQNLKLKEEKYLCYSLSNIAHSFSGNSLKIGFGFLYPSAIFLIISNVLAKFFLFVFLIKGTKYDVIIRTFKSAISIVISLNFKAISQSVRKNIKFPKFRTPEVVISSLSNGLPVILIGVIFGASAAGFYVLTYTVLKAPLTLLGKSISEVYYVKINKRVHDAKSALSLLKKLSLILIALQAPLLVIIYFWGPQVFSIVFGDEWTVSGNIAGIIAFWLMSSLAFMPSKKALISFGFQKTLLIYSTISILIRIGSFISVSYATSDFVMSLWALSLSGLVCNLALYQISKIKITPYKDKFYV